MHASNILDESLPPKYKGRWDIQSCGRLTFTITFDGETWQAARPSRNRVKKHLLAHDRPFKREKGESGDWFDVYLDSLEEVAPGVWEYCILQVWLD